MAFDCPSFDLNESSKKFQSYWLVFSITLHMDCHGVLYVHSDTFRIKHGYRSGLHTTFNEIGVVRKTVVLNASRLSCTLKL